jgi:hypothetical protein
MSLRLYLVALLIFAAIGKTQADEFYTAVSYKCEAEKDQMVIDYVGAANEWGERLLRLNPKNMWDPSDLVRQDKSGHRTRAKKIVRRCRLSDGLYTAEIGAFLPCGELSASLQVIHEKKRVVSTVLGEPCNGAEVMTSRVVVKAHTTKAIVDTMPSDEFYKGDISRYLTGVDLVAFRAEDAPSLWDYAISKNDEQSLAILFKEALRTGYWGEALMATINQKRDDLLQKILATGADPNVRPNFKTPLQLAVCSGTPQAVELLLKFGARSSIGDYAEDALTDAIQCGAFDAIDRLLAYDAKLDARWLLDLASNTSDEQLAVAFKKLIEHGLDPNSTLGALSPAMKTRYPYDA